MLAALLLAQLVVVSDPADPLRPVAEEIALQERTTVSGSWEKARGEYLVWVVSPDRLSDRIIVDFARAWRDRFPETAVGLLTARTPQGARALWRNSRAGRTGPAAAFNAAANIPRDRFLGALATHGYVTFAGHGGQTYLDLGSTRVTGADLPLVAGLVVGTASCNLFRPWARDSIALAFTEKGAAAFAGFVYSPVGGYLIGCYDGLPFRYTWPGFPIGRVIQLQNRSARQGFAALPYYLLLGDPRLALAASPPYRIVSDSSRGEERIVVLDPAPPGLLPVRIPGGAGHAFVEAGATTAAAEYGIYNSRLQALDAGRDKFVLVNHAGGPLTLRFRRETPVLWMVGALVADSLDQTLIFVPGPAGNVILLAIVFFLLIDLAVRGMTRRQVLAGVLSGALLASLHAAWVLARLGRVTITEKPTAVDSLAIAATFLMTGAAAVLYLRASGRAGRLVALGFATLSAWLPALLHLGFKAGTNLLVFRTHVGAPIYQHHMELLAAISTALILGIVLGVFSLLRRRPA